MTDLRKTNDTSRQNILTGRIHSIETFGTVDGPGIRLVVFCQGCPMRCAYCHNPDTWKFEGGTMMTSEEIMDVYKRNAHFYKEGGITVSGGEPLSQAAFVAELFKRAHENPDGRIHTCLDTSGGLWDNSSQDVIDELLAHTDLVLLDIKHADPEQYKWLCGRTQDQALRFGDELARKGVPTLIRHVVVPGITDTPEELEGIGKIISHWPNVKGLELLPYHTMGVNKYQQLNMKYRLDGVEQMDASLLPELRAAALKARKQTIMERMHKHS